MEKINFNTNWEVSDLLCFGKLTGDTRKIKRTTTYSVHLPHDYMILKERDENAIGGWGLGYFPTSSCKYEKKFLVSEEWLNRKVIVEFEGAYCNAVVKLNGNYVGKRPYGYSNFFLDITKFLKYGEENKITVSIKNAAGLTSRWYSGEGLYRNVNLYVSEKLHILPEGVKISTPEADQNVSDVVIATQIESCKDGYREIRLVSEIFDNAGNKVGEHSSPARIECAEKFTFRQHVFINDAKLWSLDEPNLYYCKSKLYDGDELVDKAENHFGIRKLQFDPKNGLRLNGKPVKLRGACFHHDNGVIGACAFDRAEERKVELLKNAGFNAMRSSHNPVSKALLNAADNIGMLIMDESFDMWNIEMTENDYSLFFEEWWQRDLEAMVDKDFNHPSVIMYSIGNEIPERDGNSDGGKWARRQADFVRLIDPTRPVTSGLCGIMPGTNDFAEILLSVLANQTGITDYTDFPDFGALSEEYTAALDVVGYNYMHFLFAQDSTRFPNRVFVGTESSAMKMVDVWKEVMSNSAVLGDFAWTGMDYIGECGCGKIDYKKDVPTIVMGAYPWILAYCGDIDLVGNRRPQSYFREILWGRRNEPYIAVGRPEYYHDKPDTTDFSWYDVIASWSFPGYEGSKIRVSVYSNADEVVLYLNGSSVGKAAVGSDNGFIAWFELKYEPGELKAVAFKDGKESGRFILETAGKPVGIYMNPDRNLICAGAEDLSYIEVSFVDNNGKFLPYMKEKVKITVTGAGTLQGSGSADPMTDENYFDDVTTTFDGRMLAVVRSGEKPGTIKVTASSQDLPDEMIEIVCK